MTALPAKAPRRTRPKCLHIRCERPATTWLVPRYGVPWPGCDEHSSAMQDALFIGQSMSDAEVRREPITTTRHPTERTTMSATQPALSGTEPGKAGPEFPTSVHRDTLRRVIEDLGFRPIDVREFTISPQHVEVEVYVREPEHGYRVKVRPDGLGAETRTITLGVNG